MGTAETGAWLAFLIGVVGAAGNYLGAVLGDRWARTDVRSRVWLPGLAIASGFPFALVIYTTPERSIALLALAPAMFVGMAAQAPLFAAAQFLAPPRMRATAAAVLLFAINIVGLGVGPASTGALSDALAPRYGDTSLARALLAVSFALVWAGFHFFLAGRTFEADLEHARRTANESAQR
jgi:MFS family permease